MSASNKTSDRKIFIKFIFIIIVAGIIGFAGGWFMGEMDPEAITQAMTDAAPLISTVVVGLEILLNVVFLFISLAIYGNAKKLLKNASEEDEDIYDVVDEKLNVPMILSSASLVLNFLLFSVGIEYIDRISQDMFRLAATYGILHMFSFIFSIVWEITMQNAIVKTLKMMNPEKQGSVFEINFQKKWEASCDEGQKKMIYQAGYRAFSRMQMACIIMWLIALMSQMFFKTGITSVVCICVIYFIGVISYSVEAMRLEHPKH